MPDYSYFPFDVTGTDSNSQDEVDYIFTSLGATSWEDVIRDNDAINPIYDRPARYLTPEEALRDIYDRGISAFTKIRYLPAEDMYTIYVEIDSP